MSQSIHSFHKIIYQQLTVIFFREYIKRHLEFGHKDNKHEDHAMIFKYKKIKQSMIEVLLLFCFLV